MLQITDNKIQTKSNLKNGLITNYRIEGFLGYGGNGNVVSCQKIESLPLLSRQSTSGSSTPPTEVTKESTNFNSNSDFLEDILGDECPLTEVVFKVQRQDKCKDLERRRRHMMNEVEVQQKIQDHPNIVKSGQIHTDIPLVPDTIFRTIDEKASDEQILVDAIELEYARNGSLFQYMKCGKFNEQHIRFMMLQLFSAVSHMHQKGYVHLDIKPENVLIGDYFNIKLADFGSAQSIKKSRMLTTIRGTPKFMSPETKTKARGQKYDAVRADIYALGLLMYLMLFHSFPKHKETAEEIVYVEPLGYLESVPKGFDSVSEEVKDLVSAMIHPDPNCRPESMEQIMEHGWFTEWSPESLPGQCYDLEDSLRLRFEQIQTRTTMSFKLEDMWLYKVIQELNSKSTANSLANTQEYGSGSAGEHYSNETPIQPYIPTYQPSTRHK